MKSAVFNKTALLSTIVTLLVFNLSIDHLTAGGKWTIVQAWHPQFLSNNGLTLKDNAVYFVGNRATGKSSAKLYRFNPQTGVSDEVCWIPIADTYRAQTYWQIHGLTWNGENFALIQQYYDTTMAVVFDTTGSLHSTFPLPIYSVGGLSWDAGTYWSCEEFSRTFYRQTTDGTIQKQFVCPVVYPSNMCIQADTIWEVEFWGDSIHRMSKDGGITGHFKPEHGKAIAITTGGTFVWYSDWSIEYGYMLYKVDPYGNGTPRISVPATSFNYGFVPIDSTRTWRCLVVNSGTGDLVVNSFHFQGSGPFSCSTIVPSTILPGDSLYLDIHFSPAAEGKFSGVMTVETSDPSVPVTNIQLAGTGVFRGTRLKVTDTIVSYGIKRTGSYSRKIIQVVNVGNVPVSVDSVSEPGGNFVENDTNFFPTVLRTSDTLALSCWFYPGTRGTFSSVLSIFSSDTSQPSLDVHLEGTAKDSIFDIGSTLWSASMNMLRKDAYSNLLSVKTIGDVNGDGHEDLILLFENGVTCCINGNADPEAELLWRYDRFFPLWGQVARETAILPDIDGDAVEDVACGYYNYVVVLSGKTGKELWGKTVLGEVYYVDAHNDFDGDQTPDAIAGTQYTQTPPFTEGQVYCLSGKSGDQIWHRSFVYPISICIGVNDFTGDGVPDAVAGSGYPFSGLAGIDGSTGSESWSNANLNTGAIKALMQSEDKDGDGILDFLAGSHEGMMAYCSSVTGDIICNNRVAQWDVNGFISLDDLNGDMAEETVPFGPTAYGVAYNGKNCMEKMWPDSIPGEFAVASDGGDLNGDHVDDLFAGSGSALFIDGKNGSKIGTKPLPSFAIAIATIGDLTGDTASEMVVGGTHYLYCLAGHKRKWGTGTGSSGDVDHNSKVLTMAPNPATNLTRIGFTLDMPSMVTISIYSLTGKLIETTCREILLEKGPHEVQVRTAGIPSGIYIVMMTTDDETRTGKLAVIR